MSDGGRRRQVLLLTTGDTHMVYRLLSCLGASGAHVTVLGAAACPATRLSRFCRRYVRFRVDEMTSGRLVDRITCCCARYGIDIVIPSSIDSTIFLAETKSRLTACQLFPVDRPETLRLLHNKWHFAGLLYDLGLPFPHTRLLETPAQATSLGLRFPLIAKPLEGQGGVGNVVCRTLAELEAYVASAQHRDQLPVLAQEYAPGADVVFGVLADKGTMLAWTIQKHLKHGRMEFLRHEPILEIGRKILSHLGFSGVAEFDLRLNDTDGSLQVLECNPRFWYSVAFSLFAGVDFARLGMERAHSCGSDAVESRMGIFIKPERAVWEVILGRLSPRHLAGSTRYALWMVVSDPLPYVYLEGRLWMKEALRKHRRRTLPNG